MPDEDQNQAADSGADNAAGDQSQQSSDGDTGAQGDSQAQGDSKAQDDGYEQRYKDLQVDHTTTKQELAQSKQLVDMMTPHVNFRDKKESESAEDDDEFVQTGQMKQQLQDISAKVDDKLLSLKFQQDNPDLKDYQHVVGSMLNKTDPRLPKETRLEEAAKLTRDFLETERKKGAESAEADKVKKAAAEAEASGIASGTTKVSKGESDDPDKPQSYKDYMAERTRQANSIREPIAPS